MRRSLVALAVLIASVAIAPAGAATFRNQSRAYELGVTGSPVDPDDLGIDSEYLPGSHHCKGKEQINGACFPILSGETSVSISINDANVELVGALWEFLQYDAGSNSWNPLGTGYWCGSSTPLTKTIPSGATHLEVGVSYLYGRDRCPEVVPSDQGLLHPGTWGTIDVTFTAP